MKRVLVLLLVVIAGFSTMNAQKSSKFKPEGNWKFEAPSAPEGYTFGSMVVTFADKKYAVGMGLPNGGDYKLPAEQVKYENSELTFKLFIEGEEINISLKPEGKDKMTGKAVYSGGDIPLTCDRETVKK